MSDSEREARHDQEWDARNEGHGHLGDPTGRTLTFNVESAEYEEPDPSVGCHGGWSATLSDGREVTINEDSEVFDEKGRKLGTLD